MNIKWAQNGGPRGWEEYSVLGSLCVGGAIESIRCIWNGELLPLVAFIGIPLTSLTGAIA
jgi:hypothetical protein